MKIYEVPVENNKIVLGVADSPKLTTGFGNVAREVYKGLYKEFDFVAFGILDYLPDIKRELPYAFQETRFQDPIGKGSEQEIGEIYKTVQRVQPDVIWLMIDPGNMYPIVMNLLELNEGLQKENPNYKGFKILAYPPIEGFPLTYFGKMAIVALIENGHDVVLWCESAQKVVEDTIGVKLDYCYFGQDHADFRPYTKEEKHLIRSHLGLQDLFLVGQIGVNKRTKNFPVLIYTAKILKERGYDDIAFYCHTEPEHPTMQGYHLALLAEQYGVDDMFLWKPESNYDTRNEYYGIPHDTKTLDWLKDAEKPNNIGEWQAHFRNYDFISRLNMLDLYMDVSQVEGWGLPIGESMMCGVPVAQPIDYHVRSEVFADGVYNYAPQPKETWSTWHTGARLVDVNPEVVADVIIELKENPELRNMYAQKGLEHIQQFKWEKVREFMVERIKNVQEK